jgi:hypothetical protein
MYKHSEGDKQHAIKRGEIKYERGKGNVICGPLNALCDPGTLLCYAKAFVCGFSFCFLRLNFLSSILYDAWKYFSLVWRATVAYTGYATKCYQVSECSLRVICHINNSLIEKCYLLECDAVSDSRML